MAIIKIKILLDDRWTEIPYGELKNYKFDECIIEEIMTREEYNKLYFDVEPLNAIK